MIADWDVAEGAVTVWTSTQMPFLVRGMLAAQFGLQDTRVRVICPAVGGGFGLKVQLFVEESIIPELSRRLSARRSSGSRIATRRWPRAGTPRRSSASSSSRLTPTAASSPAGPLRRRRRRLSRPSVDEPDRPALRGLVPARPLRRPERPLPGRHAVHEQVPVDRLPRRRLDARPGGARGADRRRGARARHRPARAAAAQHDSRRRPVSLRNRLQLRRRQLRRVDPPCRRADRLRRAARPAARVARARALPRHRLQPLRRAGRLGRRGRRGPGLPGLQLPRRGERRDGARRHGHAHHGAAVERPGPRDDDGAGRRRRARRQDRGRQGRPGRHGRHGLCDRQLRQPHGRDRQRRDQACGRRRARQAAGHRRPPVRGGAGRSRARGRPHLRARIAREELHDPRGRDGRLLGAAPRRHRSRADRDAQLRPARDLLQRPASPWSSRSTPRRAR